MGQASNSYAQPMSMARRDLTPEPRQTLGNIPNRPMPHPISAQPIQRPAIASPNSVSSTAAPSGVSNDSGLWGRQRQWGPGTGTAFQPPAASYYQVPLGQWRNPLSRGRGF